MMLLGFLLFPAELSAAAWKLSRNIWSEEDEKVYGNFIERLCESKHSNLNKFIRDSKANPLYGDEDKKFNLSPDCADLPYVIRAYVAYKLRLPFSYTSSISSKGRDQRYGRGNKPTSFKDQDYFSSPQRLFSQILLVNSGYFRTAPEVEDSDFYPVRINRRAIRPGTIYYDPDGHVAIVAKVTDDGRIRVIDGHPDRTISKPWFGSKFTRGSKINGGGFKQWRPIRYTAEGKIIRTRNHNLPDFSGDEQYQKSFSVKGQNGLSFHEYVRRSLAIDGKQFNPVSEFAFMMHDLHEDVSYRAIAVNLSIEKGISRRAHPGALPWNIYGTDGVWEEFSTPSRDARLKVSFREFYDRSRIMVLTTERQSGRESAVSLAKQLLNKFDELNGVLTVSYVNSAGQRVLLNFNDVVLRLFDLSFDPYHSIEYRWGASGEELATAKDDKTKQRFYELEKRLRNQLERVYNQATPLSMGPEFPPDVNTRAWLMGYIQGSDIDLDIVEFNREHVAAASSTTDPEKIVAKVSDDSALAVIKKPVETITESEKPVEIKTPQSVYERLVKQGNRLAIAITDVNNYSLQAD